MDGPLVTLNHLLSTSNETTPLADDAWASVEAALKDQLTFPPANNNLAELIKNSLKSCLEQISGASRSNGGGQFQYQLFQTIALLCRYEYYRGVCQQEKLHLPIDRYLQEIVSELQSSKNWTVDVMELCPLLRCLANLSYNYIEVQSSLQHNIPLIARWIVEFGSNESKLTNIADSESQTDLLCVCFGSLQNLLIETEDFASSIPVPPSPNSSSIVAATVTILRQLPSQSSENVDKMRMCGFAVLGRMLDFKDGRKLLMQDDCSLEWVLQIVGCLISSQGVEDEEFDVDDRASLLNVIEIILMEDEIGHEKLYEKGTIPICTKVLMSTPDDLGEDSEQLYSTACNVIIGLSMNKTVAESVLNSSDGSLERLLCTMQSHGYSVYVKASACLLIGNLAYDEKSVEKCFQLGLMYNYIAPVLLSLEVDYRNVERGSEREKDYLVLKSSALLSLKNFLVAQSTKKVISEDVAVCDALVQCAINTPPMDTKNYFQVLQNLRLIAAVGQFAKSTSKTLNQRLINELTENDSVIVKTFFQKIVETSRDVPIEHIKNESNRLLSVLISSASFSSNGQSDPSVLEIFSQSAISISSMLSHGSYVMMNESVVALAMLTNGAYFERLVFTYEQIQKLIKVISESVISNVQMDVKLATQADVPHHLVNLNSQLLQIVLNFYSKVVTDEEKRAVRAFLCENLTDKPEFETLLGNEVTKTVADKVKSMTAL